MRAPTAPRAPEAKEEAVLPPVQAVEERAALDAIKTRVEKLGLRYPPRPVDEDGAPLHPALPVDLTLLTDEALGRLYGQFCLMAQYAQMHLAIRSVEASVRKRVDKVTRSEVRLRTEGTVGEQEAQVETNPAVRKSTYDLLVGEGTETMINALLQGYLIGKDALSREITRRTAAAYPSPGRS